MTKPRADRGASLLDFLKAWPTYVLPQHTLSRIMHAVTRNEAYWWKSRFTSWFIDQFKVDMSLAENPDLDSYKSFNAFFTRSLRPDARPINQEATSVACPVDGSVSQLGDIKDSRIFQAKGRDYSLLELLGGDVRAAENFYISKTP